MAGNMIFTAHAKHGDRSCLYGCCHSDLLQGAVAHGARGASSAKQKAHKIQRAREKSIMRKELARGEA